MMSHHRLIGVAAVLAVVLASAGVVESRDRTHAISDVTTIENEAGASRILFRVNDLDRLRHSLTRRAQLRIPFTLGATDERTLELRVYPVTTAWTQGSVAWDTGWENPGGDFDADLYSPAKVDLRRRTGALVFDLTVALKEIVEGGMDDHGFLVSVRPSEADGIAADDLAIFQNLGSSGLDVSYQTLVSRSPRARAR
jgi:hypothetical protein